MEEPFDASLKNVQSKEEAGAKPFENAQAGAQTGSINQTDKEETKSLIVVPEPSSLKSLDPTMTDSGRPDDGVLDRRLKKPTWNKTPVYLIFSVLPILVTLAVLAVDPCANLYFRAKTVDGFSNKAIADYNAALEIRPEMYILRERANLEKALDQTNAAGRDYLGLYLRQKITPDGDAYAAMATEMISKYGVTPEALSLLRQGASLAVRAKANDVFGLKTTGGDICKINFDLILCGNKNDIKTISKLAFNDDRVEEGEAQFLKAAALRELDENKESAAILSQLDVENYLGYRAGNQSQNLLALLKLDANDAVAAEHLVQNYKVKVAKMRAEEKNGHDQLNNDSTSVDGTNEDWSLDLTSAWAAFNQENYKLALQNSDAAAVELNYNLGDIAKYQGAAANHLLRAHIFKAQNLPERANAELTSYRNHNFSGKFFIPKVYRQWLSK